MCAQAPGKSLRNIEREPVSHREGGAPNSIRLKPTEALHASDRNEALGMDASKKPNKIRRSGNSDRDAPSNLERSSPGPIASRIQGAVIPRLGLRRLGVHDLELAVRIGRD